MLVLSCIDRDVDLTLPIARALCANPNVTVLDLPLDHFGDARMKTRAGAFNPAGRFSLLQAARGALGESEYRRLRSLFFDPATRFHSVHVGGQK